MKKILALILSAMLAVTAVGCGSEEESDIDPNYVPPTNVTVYVQSGDTAVPIDVDVSHMSNPFAFDTMIIDLPKGFVADPQTNSDAGILIAYKGDPKTSTDCYTFSEMKPDVSIEDFDKEQMTAEYKTKFEGFTKFNKFEKTTCNGYDALDIGFDRVYLDVLIFQKQYYIFTDNNLYIINYTTEVEKNVKDYEQSLTSIMIKS